MATVAAAKAAKIPSRTKGTGSDTSNNRLLDGEVGTGDTVGAAVGDTLGAPNGDSEGLSAIVLLELYQQSMEEKFDPRATTLFYQSI
mgnify:CR=1 FL=1